MTMVSREWSAALMSRLEKIPGPLLRAISNIVFVRLFPVWERMGFHITRNHFHEPIPDTRTLSDELWNRQSELAGVDTNEEGQVELLRQFTTRFRKEYESLPKGRPAGPTQYYTDNPAFGAVDGEVLYCMIRHFKPRRIIEIGSGYSTYLAAQASLRNAEDGGQRAELTAIEPYPNEEIRRGFPGLSKLIPAKVESIAPAEFAKLRENDILFIDSSHVLRIGNDVQYEYLEILPRLNKGVIVHIHDVFLPQEYPKVWVKERHWFWNEQYVLQAFLAFNSAFEVLWAASYMHLRHPEKLEEAFGSYRRPSGPAVWTPHTVWPASFWMRKKA